MSRDNLNYFMFFNSRWLLRLMILITLGGLLSGCHPCSWPSSLCDDIWTKAIAYVSYDGSVYIDIPIRSNYKRTELTSIGVSRLKEEEWPINFWDIEKVSQAHDIELPLRYGQEISETKTYISAKSIENGLYDIDGFIYVYDEKGRRYFRLTGRFSYENGIIKNLIE